MGKRAAGNGVRGAVLATGLALAGGADAWRQPTVDLGVIQGRLEEARWAAAEASRQRAITARGRAQDASREERQAYRASLRQGCEELRPRLKRKVYRRLVDCRG